MSQINRYFLVCLLTCSISTGSFAFNAKKNSHHFGEPIRATLTTNPPKNQSAFSVNNAPQSKTIILMNLPMTSAQKQNFFSFAPLALNNHNNAAQTGNSGNLPSQVALDMSKVPVLDQGDYGSCVTFATTATLDALLNQGEYMSPLCTLQLGTYLANRGYGPSGWNGSFAAIALSRVEDFGIMSMSSQRSASCGKLTEYPGRNMPNGSEMSLDDYKANSIDISENISWYSVLTFPERLANPKAFPKMMERVFNETKRALATSDDTNPARVMVGVFLPYTYCRMGACGKFHANNDSWVVTNQMIKDFTRSPDAIPLGGHEMVITGYDDNATITDNEGTVHTGVFTLRNSWGSAAGDNGNYYMSYEFFLIFANEATVVRYSKDQ